jgi:hypothetical protein
MTVWSEAPQSVVNIAQEVIEKYHPDLKGAVIGFLFRDKDGSSMGKAVWGKAKKVSDELRPYLDYDFIIWISEETWIRLTEDQQTAVIDHELCHITKVDGEAKMRAHDIEEFRQIIERHGYWNQSLFGLDPSLVAQQMVLDGIEVIKRGRVDAVKPEVGAMIGE